VERHSKSGAHDLGASARLASYASTAPKKRSAKTTSSFSRKPGSANVVPASSVCTAFVTARYRRVKQATPSVRGNGSRIASMRAITPATEEDACRVAAVVSGRPR
jgi:hypothetical protein